MNIVEYIHNIQKRNRTASNYFHIHRGTSITQQLTGMEVTRRRI